MSEKTLVALYTDIDRSRTAVAELTEAGFAPARVSVVGAKTAGRAEAPGSFVGEGAGAGDGVGQPAAFRAWLPRQCQFHAVEMMLSRSDITGVQPSTRLARAGSATSAGGSPARRPTSRRGMRCPVTRSAAAITSRTLC